MRSTKNMTGNTMKKRFNLHIISGQRMQQISSEYRRIRCMAE